MWKVWLWIKEAMRGIFRNLTMNIFAALIAFISLVILAGYIILSVNVQETTSKVEKQVQISVNLKDEVENYSEIGAKLDSLEEVESYTFTSKDDAFEIMKNSLGDRSEMLTDLNFNPLPASFQVFVKNPSDIKVVAKKIDSWGIDKSIKYGEDYVDKLLTFTENLDKASFVILMILMVASGAFIYVSIRLNILNRNKELEIKDLIGAGKANAKVPFIIEGVIITTSMAALIIGLIYFLYNQLEIQLLKFYPGTQLVGLEEMMATLVPILLLIAVMVGVVSSFLSTQKYIKRH